jgi:hypothetical protein
MLKGNEYYVIVKFVTGEEVMAAMTDEDVDYVELLYPMVIRVMSTVDGNLISQRIAAAPYCQYSEDKYFKIKRSNVMFVKKLNELFVPHYTRMVEELETPVLATIDSDGMIRRLEEEAETLSDEEILEQISILESTQSEEEELVRSFIKGNDTFH